MVNTGHMRVEFHKGEDGLEVQILGSTQQCPVALTLQYSNGSSAVNYAPHRKRTSVPQV